MIGRLVDNGRVEFVLNGLFRAPVEHGALTYRWVAFAISGEKLKGSHLSLSRKQLFPSTSFPSSAFPFLISRSLVFFPMLVLGVAVMESTG